MCESKVVKGNEVLMEDVVRIEVNNGRLKLFGIFGEVREISGRIVLVDFTGHKVVVE